MTSFGAKTDGNEVVDHFKDHAHGKTILITGASANGLGAETALSLARADPAELILLGRSIGKVQPVIDEIKKINPNVKATFVPIELDKQSSIKDAVAKINSDIDKLDIMINNAGIMGVPYRKNDAGIESQLATNHIGHFILTNMLMPKIKAAGKGARIINLTSEGHMMSPVHFDDYNFSDGKTYDGWTGYGQSKTANILFTRYLAQYLAKDDILSYAVHPGVIMTTSLAGNMDSSAEFDYDKIDAIAIRNTGESLRFEESFSHPKTVQQGVATTLTAALDPSIVKDSGSYMSDCKPLSTKAYALSEENAEKLWKLSEQLVGQEYKL